MFFRRKPKGGRHRGEYGLNYYRLAMMYPQACPICIHLAKWARNYEYSLIRNATHGWGSRRADDTWEQVSLCYPHFQVCSAFNWLEGCGKFDGE